MHFSEFQTSVIAHWHGTKQLYLEDPPAPPASCSSSLTVSPVAAGCFLKFDYNWTHDEEPQCGLLLLGFDDGTNTASAAWIDSFHMRSAILHCVGTAADREIVVRGHYPAPPGPDWGWSIAIRSLSEEELEIVMHNISPEGQEDLAVQFDYTRAD
ncbi:MAG: DUF1579 family protein [Chthoniobacterales bacterium]